MVHKMSYRQVQAQKSSLYQVQNCHILPTEVLKPIFVFSEFELYFKNKGILFFALLFFPRNSVVKIDCIPIGGISICQFCLLGFISQPWTNDRTQFKRYLNRKHILASVTTLTLFKGHFNDPATLCIMVPGRLM